MADLLDELIDQSVALVGKPVAMMTKEDKVKAVQFLNDTGAFLITKSGDKVCKFFGHLQVHPVQLHRRGQILTRRAGDSPEIRGCKPLVDKNPPLSWWFLGLSLC